MAFLTDSEYQNDIISELQLKPELVVQVPLVWKKYSVKADPYLQSLYAKRDMVLKLLRPLSDIYARKEGLVSTEDGDRYKHMLSTRNEITGEIKEYEKQLRSGGVPAIADIEKCETIGPALDGMINPNDTYFKGDPTKPYYGFRIP